MGAGWRRGQRAAQQTVGSPVESTQPGPGCSSAGMGDSEEERRARAAGREARLVASLYPALPLLETSLYTAAWVCGVAGALTALYRAGREEVAHFCSVSTARCRCRRPDTGCPTPWSGCGPGGAGPGHCGTAQTTSEAPALGSTQHALHCTRWDTWKRVAGGWRGGGAVLLFPVQAWLIRRYTPGYRWAQHIISAFYAGMCSLLLGALYSVTATAFLIGAPATLYIFLQVQCSTN